VMWVVDEMINYKIDVEKCPIGIVPFGTGNDFARVLGWGGLCFFFNYFFIFLIFYLFNKI